MESFPPQCDGIPLVGWDWDAVEGEETAQGASWRPFTVTGTYDGTTFAVVGAGSPQPYPDQGPIGTPCPEPDGGWVSPGASPDLSMATDDDLLAAMRAAEEESDFSGSWIDYVEEPVGEEIVEPGGIIGDELGLQMTWSSGDVTRNRVEIGVVVATEEARRAVDERYGEGAVVLVPALTPLG